MNENKKNILILLTNNNLLKSIGIFMNMEFPNYELHIFKNHTEVIYFIADNNCPRNIDLAILDVDSVSGLEKTRDTIENLKRTFREGINICIFSIDQMLVDHADKLPNVDYGCLYGDHEHLISIVNEAVKN